MIPRIQTGDSFKGAALYYLHDKRLPGEAERTTTERVAWTHAINTLEDDPERAISEMQRTAMSWQRLRLQSGNRIDGRPPERTVMTVALAWSPLQEPSREDMIEAAQSYLRHMKWQDHQVLLVCHDDKKHPHVHLIINRIHPETGMVQDANWSKTRSQRWALQYEREQGQILCAARAAKYGQSLDMASSHLNYRDWQSWQEIAKENAFDPEYRRALEAGEWASLKHGQKRERIEFWKETGQRRNALRMALRVQVRDEFAPEWKAYAAGRDARREKAKLYDREAHRARRHFRKHGNLHGVGAVAKIKERQEAYHERQRGELWQMRQDILRRQNERFVELGVPALAKLNEERKTEYADVLKGQRGDRAGLARDQQRGARRYDTLQAYSPARDGGLTPEQAAAYVTHALAKVSKEREVDQVGRAATGSDRVRPREPARDPKPHERASNRSSQTRDKEEAKEARRKAAVEGYLSKRAHDRARERGDGGRDR